MDARAAPQLDFDANKVRAFIARYLGIDAERVKDEAHFRNDFGLDPLDQLEKEKESELSRMGGKTRESRKSETDEDRSR